MASSEKPPSAVAHPAAASQTQLRRSSRIASKATTAAAAATQPKTVSQSSRSVTVEELKLKNVFYLFPQLPIEIRLMIWALALPGPRLVCLQPRFFHGITITTMRRDPRMNGIYSAKPQFTFETCPNIHTRVDEVVMLSVSKEAREVAIKALPDSLPSWDPKKEIRFGPDDCILLTSIPMFEWYQSSKEVEVLQPQMAKIKKLGWICVGLESDVERTSHHADDGFHYFIQDMKDPNWLPGAFPNLESILMVCDLIPRLGWHSWDRNMEDFEEFSAEDLDIDRLGREQASGVLLASINVSLYKALVDKISSEDGAKKGDPRLLDCRMVAHRDAIKLYRKKATPEAEIQLAE